MGHTGISSTSAEIQVENPKTQSGQMTREDTLSFFNGDELATDVYLKKYAVTRSDGSIEEWLPSQMWRRMARAAASVEEDKAYWEDEFYRVLSDWKAVPQGSIMFALGNPYQRSSCSNCFVVPIHDDSLEGIFDAAKEMAKTYAYRGGVGIDLSPLRPAGAVVSNAARTSTGAWSYMDFYSYVTRLIGQHGRRGALMLTIGDHHPDLCNFITAKMDLTKVTGANISVRLSDAFMKSVEDDKMWTMSFETKHEKMTLQQKARDIWHLIVDCATKTAEPGILFWDTILRESPSDCYADEGFRTICTNPCVTADTWIMTTDGPQQVRSLVGTEFSAFVDGRGYRSLSNGFFWTGTKQVYRVVTDRGYTLKCTADHKIKVKRDSGIEWVEAQNLMEGDRLVLNNNRSVENWESDSREACTSGYSFDEGWLAGYLLGDGTFEHLKGDVDPQDDGMAQCARCTAILTFWGEEGEQLRSYAMDRFDGTSLARRSDCGSGTANVLSGISRIKSVGLALRAINCGVYPSKDLDDRIERSSREYHRGFLQGWFDSDGTVIADREKKSFSVRLSSTKLNNLHIAQRMLARLGILSTVYENRKDAGLRNMPDGNGGSKEYCCNANHELVISMDNLRVFAEVVNFGCDNKRLKLSSALESFCRGPYKDDFTASVRSVEYCGIEDVYDATIEDVHEFDANGIMVHNCSEIPLPAYDACTLLSMNLTKYTKNDFEADAKFDFAEFMQDVRAAVRFLDNVKEIDLSLMPLEKQRDVARRGRRIGMGTNGLGDTLAKLRLRYDSEEALQFVDNLYEFFAKTVYQASVDLAKEKGPFPIFNAEKEKNNPFLKRIGFAGVPRRNIALLTCAPTGSLSCLCQTSSGVEPVFRNFYERRRKITHNESLTVPANQLYKDKVGDLWQVYDVAHHNVQAYLKHKGIDLNATRASDIELPEYFVESDKIDWLQRVRIQATMQKWIDHAISSTCNLPRGTDVETVKKVYEEAYRQGCKGFTVYVDGCRDGVLVTKEEKPKSKPNGIIKTDAPRRPKTLSADVHHIRVKGEEYFVLVGMLEGEPYEVFAGKNGFISKECKSAEVTKIKRGHYKAQFDDGTLVEDLNSHITDEEAGITRLLSLSLRHGADIKHAVAVLERVPGDMQNFARCIARALKKHIPDGEKVTGRGCDQCSSENLVREEGCVRCVDCGWSGCN